MSNRLAWLLLVAFVPVWYLLMLAIVALGLAWPAAFAAAGLAIFWIRTRTHAR